MTSRAVLAAPSCQQPRIRLAPAFQGSSPARAAAARLELRPAAPEFSAIRQPPFPDAIVHGSPRLHPPALESCSAAFPRMTGPIRVCWRQPVSTSAARHGAAIEASGRGHDSGPLWDDAQGRPNQTGITGHRKQRRVWLRPANPAPFALHGSTEGSAHHCPPWRPGRKPRVERLADGARVNARRTASSLGCALPRVANRPALNGGYYLQTPSHRPRPAPGAPPS